MPSTSKKHINKSLKKAVWDKFLDVSEKSKSGKELVANIQKFLTDAEITLLEKRLAISILLERKTSYRAIGEMIDVTRTTISFVKHNLTRKVRTPRKYGSSVPDKKRKRLPVLPPRVGHGRWLHAKLRGQKFY